MNVTRIESQRAKSRKRVPAYCRVSTDKDAQLESLENQMEAFRYQLTIHNDWDLVNIYADKGLSGTSIKGRSKFNEMIADCEAGKIDYIITKSISRFARNTLDCVGYVRKLQKYGVQLFFEKEGIDTADSTSEMLLTIMASFAQEESRSISENVKWGIRKRFEEGQEVKVPLYGFFHTENEMFLIKPEEAEIVREVFERYVHGELPLSILNDMITRGIKPPAGDCWKRLQIDRMLKNEKYVGDAILQKTYIENHLTHKQVRNHGELPMFRVADVHKAIVDRHIFEQAQKILAMRKVSNGNCTYPYGDMLKCPYCGKTLIHGSLNHLKYKGKRIQNGGWGCYGESGCRKYLLIQNILDETMVRAYTEKSGTVEKKVDFYWLDDNIERIGLGENEVTICWRDGEINIFDLNVVKDYYCPTHYAMVYNSYLEQIRKGEKKVKYKHFMGLGTVPVHTKPIPVVESDERVKDQMKEM